MLISPQSARASAPATTRTHLFTITTILVLALALRVIPVFLNWSTPAVFMDFDSWGYQTIAHNLAQGRGFSVETAPPYEPSLYRTPGLPWLLSVLDRFGFAVPHVILLQALMSTLTVLILFLVLKRAFSIRTAHVACLLLALDPITIGYTNFLLTEIYSAFLLTGAAFFAALFVQRNNAAHLMIASAVIGLTILVHPLFLFLPLALLPLWLIHPFHDPPFRRLIRIVCALLIMYIPTGGWMLRNVYVANYHGVAAVASVNVFKIKAVLVSAKVNGTTPAIETERMVRECESKIGPDAPAEARYRCWNEIGSGILLRHPFTYAQMHVEGMVRELVAPGRDSITRILYGGDELLDSAGRVSDDRIDAAVNRPGRVYLRGLLLLIVVAHAVFLCAFVLGLTFQFALRQWAISAALLLPIAYVLMITGGPEGSGRFRVIYMPFLLTFSAIGIVRSLNALRQRLRTSSA